ncbi:thioredoxin family protein [Spirosoma radiotolerans]|uniref:thioredoxin family protein n=1 Tax=Spirosoma radiotolerans TaxID=1379870 RepID=UPI000698E7E5|nr:thioredoxin family protein [Spirosoma radiotolerans]
MIRLYSALVFTLLLALEQPLQAQSITFEKGKWKDMLARAKTEKKLIFVDVYAVWCGPCKMLDQQVFTDKQVAATYNAFFINYKVDAERGEGPALARQYNVRAYPTALFIDGDGQLVDTWTGFIPPVLFKQQGERVFKKTPLGLTLSLHEAAYQEGNRSAAFMKTYLWLRRQAGLGVMDVLNDYVSHIPADSLQTPLFATILLANTTSSKGPAFELMMRRKDEPRFRSALDMIVHRDVSSAGKERNRSEFKTLSGVIQQLATTDQVAERLAHYQLVYDVEAEDWKGYAEHAEAYMKQYLLPNLTTQAQQQQPALFQDRYDQLCNMGYFIWKNSKDDAQLSTLLTTLVSVGQIHASPLNISLQACLHYALGERDEAVALQTKALEQARNLGEDASSYEATLLRMQKKKSL